MLRANEPESEVLKPNASYLHRRDQPLIRESFGLRQSANRHAKFIESCRQNCYSHNPSDYLCATFHVFARFRRPPCNDCKQYEQVADVKLKENLMVER